MSVIDQFAPGERIVSMATANGRVLIATNWGVYLVTENNELRRLKFADLDPVSAEAAPVEEPDDRVQVEPAQITFDPHRNSVLMQDDGFRQALGEMREKHGL